MAIRVAIDHKTTYHFDRSVALSPHLIRLRPAPHARTPIHEYRLDIAPAGHRLYWQQDPFGNFVARAVFPEPVRDFDVHVRLVADMTVINPFDFFVEQYAEHYPFRYDALIRQELEPYFELSESGPNLMRWVAGVDRSKRRIVDFLVHLNQQLQEAIDYTIRLDPGIQTCEETFEKSLGSCRDTGWLLVQILRHLGLAARFVSGYLVQLTADVKALDGPSGPEQDFTDLHAWAEVYIPGAGWVGLDPTSGLFAGEGHIPLACTPDPVSAAAITGYTDPCEVSFDYANQVTRVHEDPRVTKPYTEEQWRAIRVLGRSVDDELQSLDIRLTMGGEPTFVSIDDMEGAEWNTEALGLKKRELAGVLLGRLADAFAPGHLLLYGQGKWYPGEPLPRWALGCFWRTDGVPLWGDVKLLADESRRYLVPEERVQQFGERLAARIAGGTGDLTPAYEDWLHYLWREAQQPIELDRVAIPWAPQFRDDLSLALAHGLDRPVGHVLPLKWDASSSRWVTARWGCAGERLQLLPGGSPLGLRLPIEQVPRSPDGDDETEVPHTALCLQARDDRLYVFMPPCEHLEHYATLLAAVEATAEELGLPVLIEGYEPPASPLLRLLKVTPDPGVIEVNIHPAGTWDELEHNTVTLYEAARQTRLGTEKFMLDGRHTGTGGGNHVTLGGPKPADSPFLRRPDLLRSLLTYWQHHPALSYLFSGLFIGFTSQAPRTDERGSALLTEFERSLREIDRISEPHMVDRSLRSFLADVTGNTHRAEFCIDKLAAAETATGRQGLLEFRAFEMPPHARMSLAQMLLLRALVARFWREPYRHGLVRWGTALNDRFMLPHFVWSDFASVIEDLNAAGYPFDLDWYAAFLEFRFPVYGRVDYAGLELELRMALEPWQVLEEETSTQRQARVVDSAVERLQVLCRGLDPERHLITCNGRRLPLRSTGVAGEYVAGVRYKAWDAAYGMHTEVEVHAPLVFDVIERDLGRSIGGCVYHVAHPGGRAYDTFPVNAYEAEARRITRFWAWGHTPGDPETPEWVRELADRVPPVTGEHWVREPQAERPNPAYPCTLDLRRRIMP